MNQISNEFPIFSNIKIALNEISKIIYNEANHKYFFPLDVIKENQIYHFIHGESDNTFLFNPLRIQPDDLEFMHIFNIEDGTPYLTQYKRYALRPSLGFSSFLFRGQSKDYGSIKPNLLRNKNKGYFLDDMIREQELMAFIAQHPLIQLLGIKGITLNGFNIKLQTNLLGLAQHYYNKTILVDLTSSLNIAAFFAVTQWDSTNDSYIPIDLGYDSIGVIYVLPICCSLSYNNPKFPISSIGKQFCLERPAKQRGYLAQVELGMDLVDHPLLLKFKFRHNRAYSNEIFRKWEGGAALAPSDFLQKFWRPLRENVDSCFNVSNKALEINLFRNTNESYETLLKKICDYRLDNGDLMFRITGKEWPDFPRQILEEYWADIKNGWWEDKFCKDIDFRKVDSKHLKEQFINLPRDERYKKYFQDKY